MTYTLLQGNYSEASDGKLSLIAPHAHLGTGQIPVIIYLKDITTIYKKLKIITLRLKAICMRSFSRIKRRVRQWIGEISGYDARITRFTIIFCTKVAYADLVSLPIT